MTNKNGTLHFNYFGPCYRRLGLLARHLASAPYSVPRNHQGRGHHRSYRVSLQVSSFLDRREAPYGAFLYLDTLPGPRILDRCKKKKNEMKESLT